MSVGSVHIHGDCAGIDIPVYFNASTTWGVNVEHSFFAFTAAGYESKCEAYGRQCIALRMVLEGHVRISVVKMLFQDKR